MSRSLIPLLLAAALAPAAAPPARVPLLLDTDIGDDIDDALALAVLLSSPRADLRGVTTVHGDAYTRALVACRLLHVAGRGDVPVASGSPPRARPDSGKQLSYGLVPTAKRPLKEDAVTFLYRQLKARPGELTVLAIGPLTNVAALFRRHPECRPWVRRLVVMGGALRVGYDGKPPAAAEWNVKCDVAAARAVVGAGVPLVLVPLDVTWDLRLEKKQVRKILDHGSPLTDQLAELFALWKGETPVLFDPLAALLCLDEGLCKLTPLRLRVDDEGRTLVAGGKANALVATAVRRREVLERFMGLLSPAARSAR
jgi:inosine-uridine nucleoside N-ribohydrolase